MRSLFLLAIMKTITQSDLKDVLDYSQETGKFTWIKSNSNRVKVGAVAGTIRKNDPYIIISINKVLHYAHRLAWLYVFGATPNGMIDHKDCNKSNNRISNLRLATYRENALNKKATSRSKTGLKGVWKSRSRWAARIEVNGIRISLGVFDTPEQAHAEYQKHALIHFGEFAYLGNQSGSRCE